MACPVGVGDCIHRRQLGFCHLDTLHRTQITPFKRLGPLHRHPLFHRANGPLALDCLQRNPAVYHTLLDTMEIIFAAQHHFFNISLGRLDYIH